MNNIQEIISMLDSECDKILEYYQEMIDEPESVSVQLVIENVENYLDQLPSQYKVPIIDVLSNHLSNKVAVGMCYATVGRSTQLSDMIIQKMLHRLVEDGEILCENEMILDSYYEFMQSLSEYTYYRYVHFSSDCIGLEDIMSVILNVFDIIASPKNTYYYDDITTDIDEFVGFMIPANYSNESDYYNMLNPNTPRLLTNNVDDLELVAIYGTKAWEYMCDALSNSVSSLKSIDGFIFTESNRDAVCEYIYMSLMKAYYLALFNVDIDTLNNLEAINCAKIAIFNFPGHIDPGNFLNELKLASRPYVDLFLRLILKVTFVCNNGFVSYTDGEKIESILRLKRGFENEIYYNRGNLRQNRETRRIPIKGVQRNYSRAKQYVDASKFR